MWPIFRAIKNERVYRMITVTSKNLLDFVKAYFDSLGLGTEAGGYFNAKTFAEGLVLKLPAVCLVPANKPADSRSKQTHIHVTGNNRYFFFDSDAVNSAVVSSEDVQQNVLVSRQNLKALNGARLLDGGLFFAPSYTMTKIACRASQESQVQISKLRLDGDLFIELRNSLYENDLLVFLKLRAGNALVAVGIPHSFYDGEYEFQSDIYSGLESKGTVTVKNALAAVMDEYEDSDVVDGDEAIADAVYQELVNDAPVIATFYEPVEYIPGNNEKTTKSTRPSTNPSLGKEAISRNKFCCAVDKDHPTFIKKDGGRYMEVHHLIPLEWQREFAYKLDTRANLVPLCPLCHKLIHYGRMEDKQPILTQLYEERRDALRESGLEITLDELLRFYE